MTECEGSHKLWLYIHVKPSRDVWEGRHGLYRGALICEAVVCHLAAVVDCEQSLVMEEDHLIMLLVLAN